MALVTRLERGARVAVVPVPGAHTGLALHQVGDHLELLQNGQKKVRLRSE